MSKVIEQEKLYGLKGLRIGVLGGTFDPPHLAHIHMAASAKQALNLDIVVFMPLGVAPHSKRGISSAWHRINMLEIILSSYDDFYIDAHEAYSDSLSYTVNSIERISGILGENTKMYFIIGADSLMYLEKWYNAKKLFEITDFAVIPRDGYDKEDCLKQIDSLERAFGASIVYIDAAGFNHSSTEIRGKTDGADSEMTSQEVLEYIKENNLYN